MTRARAGECAMPVAPSPTPALAPSSLRLALFAIRLPPGEDRLERRRAPVRGNPPLEPKRDRHVVHGVPGHDTADNFRDEGERRTAALAERAMHQKLATDRTHAGDMLDGSQRQRIAVGVLNHVPGFGANREACPLRIAAAGVVNVHHLVERQPRLIAARAARHKHAMPHVADLSVHLAFVPFVGFYSTQAFLTAEREGYCSASATTRRSSSAS